VPAENLTRDEARTRAALVDVQSYDVALDLTTGPVTFTSTTTVRFTAREAGAGTFLDLIAPTVHRVVLNGTELDPAEVVADSRIRLDGLAEQNEVVVVADAGLGPRGLTRAQRGAQPDWLIGQTKGLVAARALGWPGVRIAAEPLGPATRRALDVAHRLVDVAAGADLLTALGSSPVRLSTMGRGLAQDPAAFLAAAAAGVHAARLARGV